MGPFDYSSENGVKWANISWASFIPNS